LSSIYGLKRNAKKTKKRFSNDGCGDKDQYLPQQREQPQEPPLPPKQRAGVMPSLPQRRAQGLDWAVIANKLPMGDSKESLDRQKLLFRLMDFNKNGYLSLDEVDKGVRDLLDCGNMYDAKPAIVRAFQAAKGTRSNGQGKQQNYQYTYLEIGEFRLLLIWLRQYFEFLVMFKKIDTSRDSQLDYSEFQLALPLLRRWGATDAVCDNAFKIMDRDKNGLVVFDEFASWAIQYKLDLEDDLDKVIDRGGYKYQNPPVVDSNTNIHSRYALGANKANQQSEQVSFRPGKASASKFSGGKGISIESEDVPWQPGRAGAPARNRVTTPHKFY